LTTTFTSQYGPITNAKDHDQKVLETIDPVQGLPKGSFVVADRAYNAYGMLGVWNERGINFVLRAKDNMAYEVVKDLDVPKKVVRPSTKADEEKPVESHVVKDQIIRFTGKKAGADYPGTLRMVTYWVEENEGSKRCGREMRFITNNLSLSPKTIAECYKSRWVIEAFFKTIKQHLKLKAFLGTSANAVKIQVYSALITMVLLEFLAAMSKRGWRVSHLLAIIRLSLYLHRDLKFFLDWERPNAPLKPGIPPPQRPPTQNKLF
jgi:transposase